MTSFQEQVSPRCAGIRRGRTRPGRHVGLALLSLSHVRTLVRSCRILSSGRLRRVPLNLITNEFAFSFASEGWNYFRALVAEYETNPQIAMEQTTFFRFFQHPAVQSVRCLNDVLFLHKPESLNRVDGLTFYLGTYPWGDHVGGGPWGRYFDQVNGKNTRDLYGYRANIWHQPGDIHAIENEWKMALKSYHSLVGGYHPFRHGDLPEVTLLVRRDGSYRAVRYNGQHRLSVLSHLGFRKLTVLVPSADSINASLESWTSHSPLPKRVTMREIVIRETEVDDWPYVKRSLCSREQALEFFHAFFELSGRERIQYLRLPSVY